MANKNVLNVPKIWFKFSKAAPCGRKLRFRWEELSEHRFQEFIDFNQKYYVKDEISYIASGLIQNPEAMEEHKQISTKKFKNSSYKIAICCLDDGPGDIVAFNNLYLYRRGEIYKNTTQPQTTELKRFIQILEEWNDIFPVPEVLEKYGVDQLLDDAGCAVHPNFRGYGITKEIGILRRMMCKEYAVPMTGAWMTAAATQISAKRDGWETIYETKYQEVEKRLGIKFQNAPPTLTYGIYKNTNDKLIITTPR